jgi:hypothetical protein
VNASPRYLTTVQKVRSSLGSGGSANAIVFRSGSTRASGCACSSPNAGLAGGPRRRDAARLARTNARSPMRSCAVRPFRDESDRPLGGCGLQQALCSARNSRGLGVWCRPTKGGPCPRYVAPGRDSSNVERCLTGRPGGDWFGKTLGSPPGAKWLHAVYNCWSMKKLMDSCRTERGDRGSDRNTHTMIGLGYHSCGARTTTSYSSPAEFSLSTTSSSSGPQRGWTQARPERHL